MKREHLRAVVWLRWRLLANSLQRSGKVNAAFAGILLLAVAALAIGLFFVSLSQGAKFMADAGPERLLFLWGAVVLAYAAAWVITLNHSLQLAAPLSLDKLLHLPVSAAGAFLCHFVGSFASIANVVFVPVLLGLSIALIAAKDAAQWPAIPLTLALVFMVTTLAYQIQGWLAVLMSNKRTRTVVQSLLVITLMVVVNAPGFIGLFNKRARNDLNKARWAQIDELKTQRDDGVLNEEQYTTQRERVTKNYEDTVKAQEQTSADTWTRRARVACAIVPIGWLPYGIAEAEVGRPWPAWAGAVGMLLIGGLSLARSYRLALQHTTGRSSRFSFLTPASARRTARPQPRSKRLVQWSLPFVSEQCSAVTLTTFRVLLRAPEARLVLFTPFFLLFAAGGMLYLANDFVAGLGAAIRPMFVLGCTGLAGLSVLILVENQFHFDGQGLRSYLLMPVPRSEVLLGKNLAMASVGLALGAIMLGVAQRFIHLSFSDLLASFLQFITICAAFCLIGNGVSIHFPPDRSKPKLAQARTEFVTQFLVPVLIAPFAFAPVYIPLAITSLCRLMGWADGFPIYLAASALTTVLALRIYLHLLQRQSRQLQKHEINILNTLAAKS